MTDSVVTDYHLHLRGDDLNARASDHFNQENIARYVEAAGEVGVTDLGCAEHMYRFTEALTVWRHPFWDEWAIDDIDQYVEAVKASPIKLGIEGDYIVGADEKLEAMLGSRPFDYVVGSVHFLGDYSLDTEEYTIWDGSQDPDDIWRRYFETLASAARSGLFDILAHPDLVKVWGEGRTVAVGRPEDHVRTGDRGDRRIRNRGRSLDRRSAERSGGDLPRARLHGDVRRGRSSFRPLVRRPRAGPDRLPIRRGSRLPARPRSHGNCDLRQPGSNGVLAG